MDPMDIDDTFDVPDTPIRLATRGIDGRRSATEENHHLSTPCHSGQQKFLDGGEDQPVVIDSGSRGPTLPPQRCSPSFRHGHLFRRGMSDNPHYINQNSTHGRQLQSMRPLSISNPSSKEDSFVDLGERSLHRPVPDKTSFSVIRKHDRVEFPKRSVSTNGTSSKSMTKFPSISQNSSKETGSMNGAGPSVGCREGTGFVANGKNPTNGFAFLNPMSPPIANRQKRLVRNGCISPNNIAKGKQLAQKNINDSEDIADNNNGSIASSSPANPIDIRDVVAEGNDSYTRKGKGLMTYPHSSEGQDGRSNNLVGRSVTNSKEKDIENGDVISHVGKSVEERGGWRSTRTRSRGIYISSSPNGEQHSVVETDGSTHPTQHQDNNRLEKKANETMFSVGSDRPDIHNMVSPLHIRSQTLTESMHYPRGRLGQLNGPHSTADSFIKRQRQGSVSSNCAESSTSVSDDPEIVYLSSPSEATNSNYISSRGNLHRIIEVDELSPPSRPNAPDEDERARQVEEDERLARELQEQLYNEFPVFGISEADHIPLALQRQDGSNHGVFQRGSPTTNLPRQSQSRALSNVPRRGSLSRGAASGRMTRFRSRLAGQPRTLLPSRRASLFPSDMDVDTRMHILGALEEFSDLAATGSFLQFDHDFNENDYEMLLALDDNNDHHRGASAHRINSLPESIVQNDNFGEACVICLETPTNGDTIRHLPCLHKFHKDCIDEWLRRRTSCPVCKSSIT